MSTMEVKERLEAYQWLYNAPLQPNAITWSQDDLLAVATGPVVVLLNPFHLKGPRSHISFTRHADPGVALPGCHPQDRDASLQFSVACMKLVKEKEVATPPTVRSLAWSPSNCGPDGSCLLAAVLSDNQVTLLDSPAPDFSVLISRPTWQEQLGNRRFWKGSLMWSYCSGSRLRSTSRQILCGMEAISHPDGSSPRSSAED